MLNHCQTRGPGIAYQLHLAMQNKFIRLTFIAAAFALVLAAIPAAHAQAEKVKERAKDLKKKVEGGTMTTNKPPAKPAPAK